MVLIWEDNGRGIPATQKKLIFERGFGGNTGLGLFLTREILSITGITIQETGTEGEGTRFERTVPAGAYRIKPPEMRKALSHTKKGTISSELTDNHTKLLPFVSSD